MTEQGEDNEYINSSRRRTKHHNNDDRIKEHFGFTRLGERIKTCTKSRDKGNAKQQEPHRTEYNKRYYEEHKNHKNALNKEWRDKNKEYIAEKLECKLCGSFVSRDNMQRHTRTQKRKTFGKGKHGIDER